MMRFASGGIGGSDGVGGLGEGVGEDEGGVGVNEGVEESI